MSHFGVFKKILSISKMFHLVPLNETGSEAVMANWIFPFWSNFGKSLYIKSILKVGSKNSLPTNSWQNFWLVRRLKVSNWTFIRGKIWSGTFDFPIYAIGDRRKSWNSRNTFWNEMQHYWAHMKPCEILRLLVCIRPLREVGCMRY